MTILPCTQFNKGMLISFQDWQSGNFKFPIQLPVFFSKDTCPTERKYFKQLYGKIENLAGQILVQVGSTNFVSKILWLATKVYYSQFFSTFKVSQVILLQIPIETLLFRSHLPTLQDGFQNCDKVYYYNPFIHLRSWR